ncbi:MAG TPA: UbiA family prenyltransferase [archaeon]|nr:UbiA family prenyltransferase [archaeon]
MGVFQFSSLGKSLRHLLFNVRPYSWVDLVLLGYLAKFMVTKNLVFELNDLFFISGLLSLWCFFNIALEAKKKYAYRGNITFLASLPFMLIGIIIGAVNGVLPALFAILSIVFCFIYLEKKFNPLLGLASSLVRGIIQIFYFLYVLTFFSNEIFVFEVVALSLMILMLYTVRAIIGDLRDIIHDKRAGNSTLPILLGEKKSVLLCSVVLIATASLQIVFFNFYIASIPVILFAILLFFYNNGYILHQLSIHKTSFFSLSMISAITSQSTVFIALIFLGIFLNSVFYHKLERKSNPKWIAKI